MPKYVIEREIWGMSNLSIAELQATAQKSCAVLKGMSQVQWLESFVTAGKMYCVYIAPNEEVLLEHAIRGGFQVNRVTEVTRTIDPTTAE